MTRIGWAYLAAGMLAAADAAGAGSQSASEAFTIAVIPDVQQETSGTRWANRLQWIVDNRSSQNIKFVLQVGDMMNFNLDSQYAFMSEGLKILDNAAVPYATAIGNHDTAAVRSDSGSAAPGDVNANLRNTTKYNTYFPLSRFRNLRGVDETGKIDNAWHTFTAGGLDWLVLNLELWPRTGAVNWAKTIVAGHPNHNVIILTHAHLNSDGSIQQDNGGYGDNSPQYVFNNLMKPYANVRLLFCGHVGTHAHRTDKGTNGNTIYSFLQCYHDNTTNPTRLIRIDPAAGAIKSSVYCPSIGQYKNDGSTFTLTNTGVFGRAWAWGTPIINQPESAILQTGPIVERPAVVAGELAVRPMMPVSLTFDHRVLDGAPVAVFLEKFKDFVEHPETLIV